jgi:hypothetical protein
MSTDEKIMNKLSEISERNGYWSIKKVWNAVGRWITADEYKEITGTDYPEVRPE